VLNQILDSEFPEVFPEKSPSGLPPERDIACEPLEPRAQLPVRPIYRLSPLEMREVQQISDLAKGLIEPNSSPFGAPVLFVQKKNGSLRMCVDYCALNKLTMKNRFPLPRIDDLFDKLQGAKDFSSLDLRQGYNQIRIPVEDRPKTVFRTPLGHFQFNVLCFGLTNAPATFQDVMNNVLRGLIQKGFVLVYMDDILVFSRTPEEHADHLREVLAVLSKIKFYANKMKCQFFQHELTFLGHVVSAEGLKVDPQKTRVVQEWPTAKECP